MTDQSDIDHLRRGAAHTTAEIAQQPEVWRQVGQRIDGSMRDLTAPLLAEPGTRVMLTGAGTSAFAGEVLAPALRLALGRRVEAVATTDLVATPGRTWRRTCRPCSCRSRGPETARRAWPQSSWPTSCSTTCTTWCSRATPMAGWRSDSPGARTRGSCSMPEQANDQGFAMTSSFTGMTLAALLTLDPSAQTELPEHLATIAEQVLSPWDERGRELAARGYRRMVYLGSGSMKGLARESALKVLELTAGRVVAMGDSPLAFRHGPKSVLDDNTLVVMYLSNDPYTRAYDLDLLGELRQSQGDENVLAVSADRATTSSVTRRGSCRTRPTSATRRWPSRAVLFAQLLALHSSLALGLTADNPFPSGEVNRVVQGVRIHSLHSGR